MKKLTALLIAALLCLACLVPVSAQGAATVYADPVTVAAGKTLTVAVKITGNPGLMGYAIVLTYNNSVLTPVSVTKGASFPGMFNDSIGTSPAGSFRVVWTGTDDVTANATLFTATFAVAAGAAPGSASIGLSYSQADTFNRAWQDVLLSMRDITLTVIGHSFGEWIVDTEPTRTSTGLRHRVCASCGFVEQEKIPALKSNGYQRLFDWAGSLPLAAQIPVWILVVPLALIVSPFWVFFV